MSALLKVLLPASIVESADSPLRDAERNSGRFISWESRWDTLLKQQTFYAPGADRPRGVGRHCTWWYTHRSLRSFRALYRQLISDDSLFTFLHQHSSTPEGVTVARTTSPLEGGPNRAIKDLLRHHKGLTGDQDLQNNAEAEPISPAIYGAGISAEDGLRTRKGWAGRG